MRPYRLEQLLRSLEWFIIDPFALASLQWESIIWRRKPKATVFRDTLVNSDGAILYITHFMPICWNFSIKCVAILNRLAAIQELCSISKINFAIDKFNHILTYSTSISTYEQTKSYNWNRWLKIEFRCFYFKCIAWNFQNNSFQQKIIF